MDSKDEIRIVELDMVATGQRIRSLMDERNISIKEVSKRLNVSFQAVYRWQKGEALPTLCNFFLLSRLLGLKIDDLLVAKKQ